MPGWMRLVLLVAFGVACAGARAQDIVSPEGAKPPVFVAPEAYVAAPEPAPNDSNARRAKSQPGNNAPFWRGVHDSGRQAGYTDLPGAAGEGGVLVQRMTQYPGSRWTNAGEAWRQVRNQWLLPYGGALLAIVVLAIALFHWRRGPLGGDVRHTGRTIERFTAFERAAHWSNAVAFVILAVSGLVMAFGKFVLLPVIGGTLFGGLTYALKTMHNFVGPLFVVSLVIVFFTFVRDNLPQRGDLAWLARFGGLFSGHEVPSHRFNAGEKVVFWAGVLVLGVIVVASGLVLDKVLPGVDSTRGTMQLANMVHAVATVLMMALFLGHIYIGTIGMKGAYAAMRDGQVDEGWAEAHHELWYDDIKAGNIPAQRTAAKAPAGAPRRAV